MEDFETLAKLYVDHLYGGGTDLDIQKFLVLLIVNSLKPGCGEYTDKLLSKWPTYQEDIEKCQSVVKYNYPHTIRNEILSLKLDKDVRIIDIGCGPGYGAYLLREHGYVNIDGLDRLQSMINAAQKKNLYKHVFCCEFKPGTEIISEQYDVLVSAATMFEGSIQSESLKEFVRLVKIGGIIIWNLSERYNNFKGYESYDDIIQQMIDEGVWSEVQPRKRFLVYLNEWGYVNVMKRLK